MSVVDDSFHVTCDDSNREDRCTFGDVALISGTFYYSGVDLLDLDYNSTVYLTGEMDVSVDVLAIPEETLIDLCGSNEDMWIETVENSTTCPADGLYDFETTLQLPDYGSRWLATGWFDSSVVEMYIDQDFTTLIGSCTIFYMTQVTPNENAWAQVPSAFATLFIIGGMLLIIATWAVFYILCVYKPRRRYQGERGNEETNAYHNMNVAVIKYTVSAAESGHKNDNDDDTISANESQAGSTNDDGIENASNYAGSDSPSRHSSVGTEQSNHSNNVSDKDQLQESEPIQADEASATINAKPGKSNDEASGDNGTVSTLATDNGMKEGSEKPAVEISWLAKVLGSGNEDSENHTGSDTDYERYRESELTWSCHNSSDMSQSRSITTGTYGTSMAGEDASIMNSSIQSGTSTALYPPSHASARSVSTSTASSYSALNFLETNQVPTNRTVGLIGYSVWNGKNSKARAQMSSTSAPTSHVGRPPAPLPPKQKGLATKLRRFGKNFKKSGGDQKESRVSSPISWERAMPATGYHRFET